MRALKSIANVRHSPAQNEVLSFAGFPHGLNTSLPADRIALTEASKLVNWTIEKDGTLVSRTAISKYTTEATDSNSPVKEITDIVVDGGAVRFLVDGNYKLYLIELPGTTLFGVATFEGATTIIAYNNGAVFLDGGYIKTYNVGWDSHFRIAYDAGSGTTGFQFDKTALSQDSTLALGNGTNVRVAQKFTTQAWTAGWTIPAITCSVYLDKTGSPTGNILMVLRNITTGAVMATKTLCTAAKLTDGTAAEFSASFDAGDTTTEMSPETAYYMSLEYELGAKKAITAITKANPGVVASVGHGLSVDDVVYFSGLTQMTELNETYQTITAVGDVNHFSINDTSGYVAAETTGGNCGQLAGNTASYVNVHCHDVTSGGGAYHYAAGAYAADATKDCVMSVSPGRPPKAAFGCIWNKRLHVAGDPDNPGQVWYCNLSPVDWSTADGGGYFTTIDSDANNFDVGGLIPFFGDLYIFGKENQPYLVKVSGVSPDVYVQELAFQNPWTTHKALVSSVNDIWYAGSGGVSSLSGVQSYGDLRTFFASDPVFDRIKTHWDTDTAILGYYPQDGQIWLIMPTYHRVLVCNTKSPTQGPDGNLRYPWMEYEFYLHNLTDTDTYKWTKSASGTNEYYVTLAAGTDPGFDAQPDFITLEGVLITEGTAGSLDDHYWDYKDNDTLGYSTVYFRDDTGDPDTSGVDIRTILLPTCLSNVSGTFYLGASDGYVYKIDADEYKDLGSIQIDPKLNTAYLEIPFSSAQFTKVQVLASSLAGGTITLNYYTNGYFATASSQTLNMSLRDNMLVDDATMDVDDILSYVDSDIVPLFEYVNFNARSLMVSIDGVAIAGYPMNLNGLLLKYRRLKT